MRGRCMSKKALQFWQFAPPTDQIPMWVAIHCTFNGDSSAPRIAVRCSGEDFVLDPGDFVVERPGGDPYVLSEGEFHQMFDICAEPAAR